MKPRTNYDKILVGLDETLPKISTDQKLYAYKHCLPHQATRLKSGRLSCLECGHQWQSKGELEDKILGVTCPSCNTDLKVIQTRKKNFFYQSYYTIISRHEGFQVVRMCFVSGRYRDGEPAHLNLWEIYRNYIDENGKRTTIGMYQTSRYYDTWGGDFELRSDYTATSYYVHSKVIYPKFKIISKLRRNGMKKGLHGVEPTKLFQMLLTRPIAETLMKAKQYDLLRNMDRQSIYMHWPSIKICIRNNYIVKDASIWFDHLDMLRDKGKDLHNPKYVCPPDLIASHNKLVAKQREIMRKRKLAKQRAKIMEDQKYYEKLRKNFFGLSFSDGDLTIKFLDSVQEVMEEGDALKHCVFASNYHKNKNSLLFSARKDSKRIATVEFDIKQSKVVQVRGLSNSIPDENESIKRIVHKNRNIIQEVSCR